MDEIFGPGGLIARHHPNYEYRPGQIEMAEAVDSTLMNGGVALIEAGTGTGKTLAYLIPALAAERRVIVSTATKNLQEQLFKKDIPFLQKVIERDFVATCMKGRSNYVCLHRLKKAEELPILQGMEQADQFDQIRRWAATSETGDRAELTELPEDLPFWHQIDARGEICMGHKCPDFDECFVTRMRKKAAEADVVIVNHHLFFADLAMRGDDYGAVLPKYSAVIFDEAHELEDIAASYFGVSVSTYRIADLIQDAGKLKVTPSERAFDVGKAVARLQKRSETFWLLLTRDQPGEERNAAPGSQSNNQSNKGGRRNVAGPADTRYAFGASVFATPDEVEGFTPTAVGEAFLSLTNSLTRLASELKLAEEQAPELEKVVARVESLKFDLEFVATADDPSFVYWAERRGRGMFLNATPIDVSGILSERLFNNVESAILTSATMTAGKSFSFLKSRLGVGEAREVSVESHFDFETQAMLYLPLKMPDPRGWDYNKAATEEIIRIIEVTRGRAFVLFTNASSMRDTYEIVRGRIDYPALVQGQGSKTGLLDRFRKTEGAVLFATSSFWQGVDVQGDALSCVVIHKLPFAVPSDPVIAARQNYIERDGGNSFYDYSVPEAIITLKQGIGRLIRSKTDHGLLAVLDPRLRTKAYGRLFLSSLPRCPVTSRIEDAAAFFANRLPANSSDSLGFA